jgi:undecaprenyl-phosphate galactose phosphotransferase/putative colanic acid biosynthesis UDP-glucose lipid carrier transferase
MSLFGIICLLPFLLVVGIMIKIDSPGPILFLSKRHGRNGRVFNIYKST